MPSSSASAKPRIEEVGTAAAPQVFTWRQRLALTLITFAGWLYIRLVCPTLRWSVEGEDGGPTDVGTEPLIGCLWHRATLMACWHYRDRKIAIMTSSSFDGEYIARIVSKFGFVPVRGSSTRGGVRALLGMHRELEAGRSVAFTIDGPKGPLYVAKPGPVLLARNSRVPIVCFFIDVDRAWVLNSWDRFIVPKPFARAAVRLSKLVHVPADTDSATLDRCQAEMQAALDRARERAEAAVGKKPAD